jgi:hypothetical protein
MNVWSDTLTVAEIIAGHPLLPGDDQDEQVESLACIVRDRPLSGSLF